MSMCESCWDRAFRLSLIDLSKDQADHYEQLIQKARVDGITCSPKEQAGQWWDEERQCDSRSERRWKMPTHDELVELQTLEWVLDLVDISLPDLYSQPCLDDAVRQIKERIDKVKYGTNPTAE